MSEVKERLKAYLKRDKTGMRKELLLLLLQGGKYSSSEIQDFLKSKGYEVSQKGVSAMIGFIGSRLGIIKSDGIEKRRYFLKKEYAQMVKEIVESNL
ncbi:MAG: hypothetical protein PWQ22_690 [Archaeoglobaceae archaeon]|nr:hypothetical protein [Archaeoglobaceae archaeon]